MSHPQEEGQPANGEPAGVYAGSFDPVTRAHLDIIFQAARVLPRLIVVVGVNSEKNPWFTDEERVEMLKHEIEHVVKPKLAAKGKSCEISVQYNSGLTAAFLKANNAIVNVRGLRPGNDFDNEYPMAMVNHDENPDLMTIFLIASDPALNHVSSSFSRELARLEGQSLEQQVTPYVAEKLRARALEKNPHPNP
jgi:pantetheine-phosphate adenylyltransferase